jgi:hypothetical protein
MQASCGESRERMPKDDGEGTAGRKEGRNESKRAREREREREREGERLAEIDRFESP